MASTARRTTARLPCALSPALRSTRLSFHTCLATTGQDSPALPPPGSSMLPWGSPVMNFPHGPDYDERGHRRGASGVAAHNSSERRALTTPARVLLVIDQPILADLVKLALNHGVFMPRVGQTVE